MKRIKSKKERSPRRAREGMKRGVYILPNLFTSASLFCGFYAIIAAFNGTYLDAAAAYKWLTWEKKVSAENIIAFGRSLGATVAAQLASKVGVRGLVIESAFTSYADIGRKFYPYMPVRWFARFRYPTIEYVRKVDCPVMLIHSRNDDLVPFEFGLELYEAANEPKEFVEIFGSHNDGFLVSSEIYRKAWAKWLKLLKRYERKAKHHQAS